MCSRQTPGILIHVARLKRCFFFPVCSRFFFSVCSRQTPYFGSCCETDAMFCLGTVTEGDRYRGGPLQWWIRERNQTLFSNFFVGAYIRCSETKLFSVIWPSSSAKEVYVCTNFLSIYLSIYLSICLSIYLSVYLLSSDIDIYILYRYIHSI